MLSFHAGNLRRILGIHPIKSFIEDKLLWFGQKAEFSFSCKLFLLKKQNQYTNKFYNTHAVLYPIVDIRGCKTTELKGFCDVEPLKLKRRHS